MFQSRSKIFVFRLVGLALMWFLLPLATARAHDPGLSAAVLQLNGETLRVDVSLALGDVRLLVPELEAGADGKVVAATWEAALPRLKEFATNAMEVVWDAGRVQAREVKLAADDGQAIHMLVTFPREKSSHLSVRSALISKLSRGHREYAVLRDEQGMLLAEGMLDVKNDRLECDLHSTNVVGVTNASRPQSFSGFLKLGVEHILTGYDHLCFLLGLLIVGGSFKQILKIITAFTLAHSITLALTVMEVIQIPSRIVEPLIAVSIVYVGLENIFLKNNFRRRWLLSFGLGLVHGCGFAAALRELNVGADGGGIMIPLLSFNLGVELGQLAIAAIVVPIIWKLKNQPKFSLRFAPACSVLVAMAGAYWLVQRVWH